MSVQASETHYCSPRETGAEKYTAVEVGYPTQVEELIMPWCEDDTRPCDTIYGYVPSHRVSLVITKHGGMVEGEVPNGVLIYDKAGQKLSSTG